jgi:hypothetical protein
LRARIGSLKDCPSRLKTNNYFSFVEIKHKRLIKN